MLGCDAGFLHPCDGVGVEGGGIDVADASKFDPFGTLLHVLVSPERGEVRAYRIVDGEIRPVD